jgi:hypothetical protein
MFGHYNHGRCAARGRKLLSVERGVRQGVLSGLTPYYMVAGTPCVFAWALLLGGTHFRCFRIRDKTVPVKFPHFGIAYYPKPVHCFGVLVANHQLFTLIFLCHT